MKSIIVSLIFAASLHVATVAHAADGCAAQAQRTPSLERAEAEASAAKKRLKEHPSPENKRRATSAEAQLAVEIAVNTPVETYYDRTLASKLKAGMGGPYLDLIASVGKPQEMTINPDNVDGALFYSYDPKTAIPSKCTDNLLIPVSGDLCHVLVTGSVVSKVSCLSDGPA